MRRTLRWRDLLFRTSKRFRLAQPRRPFCTNKKPSSITTPNKSTNNGKRAEGSSLSKFDAYRELENLNFTSAAKILFSEPQKKKKFGIDFHLVQLFFACMPSLAVYLVAQYARHEMRRMEAELELKKQAEEEAKTEDKELESVEEKETISDPNLLEVKKRLDRLEETVKEIVVESKKQSGSTITKKEEDGSEKKPPTRTEPSSAQGGKEGNDSTVTSDDNKKTSNRSTTVSGEAMTSESVPVSNASEKDQKGIQDGGPCQDAK